MKREGTNYAVQTQRTITVVKHLGRVADKNIPQVKEPTIPQNINATVNVGRVVGDLDREKETVQGTNYAQPRNLNTTKDVGRVVGEKGEKGEKGEGVIPGGEPGQVLGKKTSADYDTEWQNGSGGSWSTLSGKPFNTLDTTTLKVVNNILSVNTVDSATLGNIQPITSNAVKNEVNTAVGNIEVLLSII